MNRWVLLMALVASNYGCDDRVACTGGATVQNDVCMCPEPLVRVEGECVERETNSLDSSVTNADASSPLSDAGFTTMGDGGHAGLPPARDAGSDTTTHSDAMTGGGPTNECGGPASAVILNKPNEPCTNEQLGTCARSGKFACAGTAATVCDAPIITVGEQDMPQELCDNLDNDCDGIVDDNPIDGKAMWYPDCDEDGYALCETRDSPTKSCTKPAHVDGCGWTQRLPGGLGYDTNDRDPFAWLGIGATGCGPQ